MHRPDGMGEDRYRERLNMTEAARHTATNWAIVTRAMDVINDGFTSREAAAAWMERRLDSHPEPDWAEEDVEIQAIA